MGGRFPAPRIIMARQLRTGITTAASPLKVRAEKKALRTMLAVIMCS
jgi:hypothetical protein